MKKPRRMIGIMVALAAAWTISFAADEPPNLIPPRLLGIFGGMGPEATANCYELLVRSTPAHKDQDHIPTLIFSFPQVPDRTESIRSGDRRIIPFLVQGVRLLERNGASLIIIPCNTAHYFYDEMQSSVKIPIVHMIRETVARVTELYPQAKRVGLLATSGTIRTGLYEKEFRAKGIEVVIPEADVQESCVMRSIGWIKSGTERESCRDLLASAGETLEKKGAEVLVLGCTEIPLAFDVGRARVPVVNASQVLVDAAARLYRSQTTEAIPAGKRGRLRDFGLTVGVLPTGPGNALTDVAGVQVGQVTLLQGDKVRTGVTAVLPHPGNLFREKVPAAVHVGNGFGKLSGSTQVEELGNLETPIVLTNTLAVPTAMEALIDHTLRTPGNEDVRSVNAVVGETNDGYLNDIRSRSVQKSHVLEALAAASSGPVAEGSVGAGTGTVCFGFKGGIGTASRRLPVQLGGYTVGALVQSNFGGVLQIGGIPAGKALGRYYLRNELEGRTDGSCMIVIATDAPLTARNLKRLAARAMLGLARTGGIAANGSGDYAIAFSTAPGVRIFHDGRSPLERVEELGNEAMSPLFLAAIESTEEAILNSLFQARTMTGADGHTAEALPVEKLLPLFSKIDIRN